MISASLMKNRLSVLSARRSWFWFVRDKKTFVMFANHHHDDRLALWCA